MVGVTGIEPAASASRKQRSTKLSYTPMYAGILPITNKKNNLVFTRRGLIT